MARKCTKWNARFPFIANYLVNGWFDFLSFLVVLLNHHFYDNDNAFWCSWHKRCRWLAPSAATHLHCWLENCKGGPFHEMAVASPHPLQERVQFAGLHRCLWLTPRRDHGERQSKGPAAPGVSRQNDPGFHSEVFCHEGLCWLNHFLALATGNWSSFSSSLIICSGSFLVRTLKELRFCICRYWVSKNSHSNHLHVWIEGVTGCCVVRRCGVQLEAWRDSPAWKVTDVDAQSVQVWRSHVATHAAVHDFEWNWRTSGVSRTTFTDPYRSQQEEVCRHAWQRFHCQCDWQGCVDFAENGRQGAPRTFWPMGNAEHEAWLCRLQPLQWNEAPLREERWPHRLIDREVCNIWIWFRWLAPFLKFGFDFVFGALPHANCEIRLCWQF